MSNVLGIKPESKRWKAVIEYRTDNGPVDTEHFFDEIYELHDFIERGPHWDTIIHCTITRFQHNTAEDLTVEQAAQM